MHTRQWFLGLVGVGAMSGLLAAGCGSSSSKGPSADAAAESGDDAAACAPQAVIVPDSGPCGACLTSMCASALTACNADCTCAGPVNMAANCLAALPPPPPDAGPGIAGLLGAAGPQLIQCLLLNGGGAGALGGLGGGAAGGPAGGAGVGGGASSAATGYIGCLATSCSAECFGVAIDGGPDAVAPTDSGPADAGSQPEASIDGGAVDAAPEAASEASAADSPNEAAADASDAGLATETSDN